MKQRWFARVLRSPILPWSAQFGDDLPSRDANPGVQYRAMSLLRVTVLRAAVCATGALAACNHDAPFATATTGDTIPFSDGSPRRLTYNPYRDRAPAWLPPETGFLYSAQLATAADRCLALMPPDGGQIMSELCYPTPAPESTFILTAPAAAPAGPIAYVLRASGSIRGSAVRVSLLLRPASFTATELPRTLVNYPVRLDTIREDEPDQLGWFDATRFAYLATRVGYEGGFSADTVQTGAEIVVVDLASGSPALSVVPGTENASGVAPLASDRILYTLGGDSRVFARVLSSGMTSVAWDFGAGEIARDVRVNAGGTRLAAVVGGNVSYGFDAQLGYMVQRDSGGALHVVDLAAARDSILPDSLSGTHVLFRRPALAPSGKRVVAEAWTGSVSDLWMFDLP